MGAARGVLLHNQPAFRELACYRISDETFSPADADTIGFWQKVAERQTVALVPLNGDETYPPGAREIDGATLRSWFPDAFAEGVWAAELETAVERKVETLTAELDFLPGADYADLLERPEFEDGHGRTFADVLEVYLPSDIAREFVRKRHINRNFATYSAIFYGTFAGIDAETFYYRAVQPNEMMLDHRFDSDASLQNLLEQLDNDEPDFYQTVSALNPQIVTYLLEHHPDRARQVAGFIATHFDDNAREFMSAYFAEDDVPHAALVDLLGAHPWRGLFDHLASDAVPDNLRLGLVDAALTHATAVADFALDEDIRLYIAENYTQMHAFTEEGQREQQAGIVRDFARKCDLHVEDLAKVAQPLRRLLVAARMYLLTADNLRAALGVQGSVSLDVVAHDETVYIRCITDIDTYLQITAADAATSHAVEGRETLLALLGEDHEWSASQLALILQYSSPHSAVMDLSQTPPASWRALAGHHRFVLTVSNLNTYIGQLGVDAELAGNLTADGAFIESSVDPDTDDADGIVSPAETRYAQLALDLLNAHEQLEASDRAALADQLGVRPTDLPLTEIEPVPDDLFLELLDRGLLEPSEEAFDHFATAGWPAVAKALARHDALRPFVTATRMNDALIRGLLDDDAAPAELHDRVLGDFDAFVAMRSAEPGLYRAAARRAVKRPVKLDIEHISQIASYAPDFDTVVPLLAAHQGLDGDQLVAILMKLEAPYNLLQTVGEEADMPDGDAAATLFNRLDATGMVKLMKRRTRFRVL